MTCKISRPVFAFVLALGLLAAFSSPGRAALSTADRTTAARTEAAPQTAALAETSAPVVAAPAAAAPIAAKAAPVVSKPRRTIVRKATPRRIAASPRAGYPCH